jgi:uncharacterized MnhB-related membrane protein
MLFYLIISAAIITAAQAIRVKRLIASALWLAGTSALLSISFYLLGAPTVAAIELSVGAGLVTVLFVFAINIAGEEAWNLHSLLPKPLAAGLVILMAALLGGFILPALPIAMPVANVPVNEPPMAFVLWRLRGLDVLVQIVLIFSGVLGLLGLLAEAEPPLELPAAKEFVAKRERELSTMQSQMLEKENL